MKLTEEQYESALSLFETLGIKETEACGCDLEELKKLVEKNRRSLAKKYHTDKNKDIDDEKIKELNFAKDELDKFIEKAEEFPGYVLPSSRPQQSSSSANSDFHQSSHKDTVQKGEIFTGNHCKIENNYGTMQGNHCKIKNNYGTMQGNHCKIENNHGTVIGNHCKVNRGNKPSTSHSTSGSGTSSANIEINVDGSVFINGKRIPPGTSFTYASHSANKEHSRS